MTACTAIWNKDILKQYICVGFYSHITTDTDLNLLHVQILIYIYIYIYIYTYTHTHTHTHTHLPSAIIYFAQKVITWKKEHVMYVKQVTLEYKNFFTILTWKERKIWFHQAHPAQKNIFQASSVRFCLF